MFELNCPDFLWASSSQNSFSCYFTAFTNNDGLSLVSSLNGSNTVSRMINSTSYNYAISTLTFTGIPALSSGSYILNAMTQIASLGFSTWKPIYSKTSSILEKYIKYIYQFLFNIFKFAECILVVDQ